MAVLVRKSAPGSPTPSSASSYGTASSGNDLIASASSALRRLHFKSAGAQRMLNRSKTVQQHQQQQQQPQSQQSSPVPKLKVLGSSSVSIESSATVNTSTDSSAATMTTVTDDTENEDNFDNSFEPKMRIIPNLLDEVLNGTQSSSSAEKDDEFYSASSTEEQPRDDPKAVFTVQDTAPEEYEDSGMPLMQYTTLPSSFHHNHHNNNNYNNNNDNKTNNNYGKDGGSAEENTIAEVEDFRPADKDRNADDDADNTLEWRNIMKRQALLENLHRNTIIANKRLKLLSRRYAKSRFEEDRTRTEIGRNSSGFAAEQMTIDSEDSFQVDNGSPPIPSSPTGLPGSPTCDDESSPTKSKQHFTFPTVNETDEPNDTTKRRPSTVYNRTPNWNNKERKNSAVLLDALVINKSQSAAVVMSDTGQVATIVVQQPSLSANSPEQGHEGCQTAPVELPIDFNRWPDFANSISSQQYHDFQMKYGSPHHSRSQSVRTSGSKSTVQLQLGPNGIPKNRSNQLTLPQQRSRVASMPNTGVEEEYYRIRQFSISGKGIINRGDSLKSRRSKSNNSVASSNSSTEHLTASNYTVIGVGCGGAGVGGGGGSYPGSARTSAGTSLASSRESSCASCPGITQPFRIAMLGATGVGKTSLVCQFMTSESLHIYDASIDEDGEKSVSVLLDAEESELIFLDKSNAPVDCNDVFEESPHAYCIIYSRNDWDSFKQAEEWLQALWKADVVRNKAVILVGNKNDIVRPNVVPSGVGKQMATRYDCKFIETSVIINYNVDELLVGILTQIRLKLDQPPEHGMTRSSSMRKRSKSPLGNCGPTFKKYRGSRTSTSLRVKGLLSKVWARDSKSKSCENLHVL
uniref:GTP-binding protein REM 1 n=1 Tax=Schizaphis graminum TaxID=13262 RepID=A0A2S2P0K1_SCHGA